MTHDPLRTIRLKWGNSLDPGRERDRLRAPRRDAQGAPGTPRFVGRIVSGGSTPIAPDRVFLVAPVGIDGDESEGAPGSVVGDPSHVIPVVIVGTTAPAVGDVVLVHSIGGRWVAERNGPAPTDVACFPCNVPRRDLTLSWTNLLTGSGSTPLAFDGAGRWQSACSGQIVYTLACQSGVLAFSAAYFPDGDCPDGSSQACSSADAAPQGLAVVQAICDPLVLTYAPTSATCPYLAARGFTKFIVTQ